MSAISFASFFKGIALNYLIKAINLALDEDGADLTSRAVFSRSDMTEAKFVAKEDTFVTGLPIIPLVLEESLRFEPGKWTYKELVQEGSFVKSGTVVAEIHATTRLLLKAERVFINFIGNLSGISNLTSTYVKKLEGTNTRLLDTRKTSPCLRYPQKYAVLIGGGFNHRANLEEMLMLKDNHIDSIGSITQAVQRLRNSYSPCPPIEVECRNLAEVKEAVKIKADRIMLDNMDAQEAGLAMALIPTEIESEISGGISLDSIAQMARISPRGPDFISVGRLTHSAPVADFSLRM